MRYIWVCHLHLVAIREYLSFRNSGIASPIEMLRKQVLDRVRYPGIAKFRLRLFSQRWWPRQRLEQPWPLDY
jgi:hypothetical protein